MDKSGLIVALTSGSDSHNAHGRTGRYTTSALAVPAASP